MNVEKNVFKCSYCENQYQYRQSLTKHLRREHKVLSSRCTTITCPGISCDGAFQNREQLREHVASIHHVEIVEEQTDFESFEDFKLWKDHVERKTKCRYVAKQTRRTLAAGGEVHYYSCFRSGSYAPRSKSTRKKEMKSKGSRKIGGCCPSSMDVYVYSDETIVRFWPTHFGHDVDIGHMFLSSNDKKQIACKLRQGTSFDKILEDVRQNPGEDLKRINLLTRADLHNIVRDFGIQNCVKFQADDTSSIKSWVESMNEAGENSPVIYFKDQDEVDPGSGLEREDFELVIMTNFQCEMFGEFWQAQDKVCFDSTHGTNHYKLQLTTLMVIDEFGSGCPVAFCISSRVDEVAIQVFLKAVQQKAGSMSCSIFMSDDNEAFHNAWKAVMGPSTHQLLCTWNVAKSWRRQLNKISSTAETKDVIYKALRYLMQEHDIKSFNLLYGNFMKQILEDDVTMTFRDYFINNFASRIEAWALCFRTQLGINTEMHLESMHKILKQCYVEGRKNKCIGKTVDMLMSLSRDHILDRLIKLLNKVPYEKIKKMKDNHQKGLTIDNKSIQLINENKWSIQSENSSKSYIVQKISLKKICKNCKFTCSKCKICIHMYKCTCVDNFTHLNICQHIHACLQQDIKPISALEEGVNAAELFVAELVSPSATENKSNQESLAQKRKETAEELFVVAEIVPSSVIENKSDQKESLETLRRKVKLKVNLLNNLIENLEHMEEETCTKVMNLLDETLSILRQAKKSSGDRNEEPPNKRLKP